MLTYYWRGRPNFGDALAPILLREFAGVEATWSPIAQAEIVTIGSVLQGLPDGWAGTVLGSGRLRAGIVNLSRARVLAVRGPLSAPDLEVPYGDPALLLPLMLPRPTSKFDVVAVPHWSDTELSACYPEAHVVDVTADPMTVVAEIASARRVITSSLHGMIVAHAYGIPAQARMCPRVQAEGGSFKWWDYADSVGGREGFGQTWKPSQDRVEALQRGLLTAYREAA